MVSAGSWCYLPFRATIPEAQRDLRASNNTQLVNHEAAMKIFQRTKIEKEIASYLSEICVSNDVFQFRGMR